MKLHILCLFALTGCSVDAHDDPSAGGDPITGPTSPGAGSDAAAAACRAADGPLHPYTQAAELEQLLVGKWRRCSGPALIDPTEAGIELVDDHTYFKLVTDGAGALVRTSGFANQGTWDVAQETPTSVQFDYHPAPNSGNGGYPRFEDGPRKMSVTLVTQTAASLYLLEP